MISSLSSIKIQQVLYNLIDNATKFSNNNSTIKIETHIRHEKVFVSVKDHGIGIPSDSIKKIWERFYKSDSSRGIDKKGTGLGLSIVKHGALYHGTSAVKIYKVSLFFFFGCVIDGAYKFVVGYEFYFICFHSSLPKRPKGTPESVMPQIMGCSIIGSLSYVP